MYQLNPLLENTIPSPETFKSIRSYLKHLSNTYNIPFQVLRGRFQRGLRGEDLINYQSQIKSIGARKLDLTTLSKLTGINYNNLASRYRKGLRGPDLVHVRTSYDKSRRSIDPKLQPLYNKMDMRRFRIYTSDHPIKTIGRSIDDNETRQGMYRSLKKLIDQGKYKEARELRDLWMKEVANNFEYGIARF